MDHYQNIYTHHADNYHALIAPEDADGNLRKVLLELSKLKNKRVVDLGTGTGRFALWFAAQAKSFVGLDLHAGMLRQNLIERKNVKSNWELVNGDARYLPLRSACAEVVLAGWALGHLRKWYEANWQVEIGRVLNEMERLTVNDGALIIVETLGTGSLTPAPPAPHLADYYAWLENAQGFTRHEISTDYQYANVEEAVARTEFFFGAELTQKIRANNWARVPEWTGVWVKKKTA